MAVEMEVVGVRVELPGNQPILMLRESGSGRRTVPIYIGGPEAQAIAFGLDHVVPPRPMTHDLLTSLLSEVSATIHRVVVTTVRNGVFYADIVLEHGGDTHVVSARPSDAVAIAVRANVPIYADETVIDEVGYVDEEDEGEEQDAPPEEVVEQFKEFIDSVSPEDFAS